MNRIRSASLKKRLILRNDDRLNNHRLRHLGGEIAAHRADKPMIGQRPVVFFRASTGVLRLSQNTAFGLLASRGLELAGIPVVHFVCQAGMSRCVQGTQKSDHLAQPPCAACIRHSHNLYARANVHAFEYAPNAALAARLRDLTESTRPVGSSYTNLVKLASFILPPGFSKSLGAIPLGPLVLPSLRWILRRHHLVDNEPTRYLLREYILSAYNVAEKFAAMLDEVNPQALVVFNGMFFPEGVAKWVAQQRGVRVITHEVALRPFAAFFTEGEATAYPIEIPEGFQLTPEQDARLEAYLQKRFHGDFTMAGIRFWPEMRDLDDDFLQKAAGFKQIVPVFTNVIFDTSQVHANVVFSHMFAWLDAVLDLIRTHPETLFVIRAHPDEMRASKESQESVRQWAVHNHVEQLPNVVFVGSEEHLSSYRLIQRSKFVMVYNSSIGLEAALMGAMVLCAGKARYTQYPMAILPESADAYRQQAEGFLAAEQIAVPPEYALHARLFLYYQLYKTALPFGDFLEEHHLPGFVRLRKFDWKMLSPSQSLTTRILVDGIIHGQPFLVPDEAA